MRKDLIEKKNDYITRAEEILNGAKAENRELTAEEVTKLEELHNNVRSVDKTIELEKEFEGMDRIEEKKDEALNERAQVEAAETEQFDRYLRGKLNERNATNMTVDDNGDVIPTTIAKRIIKQVYDISPILSRSTVYTDKGKLELPYYDETDDAVTVEFKEEFSELTSHVGKLATFELTGYLAGALTLISRSLINNTNFDLVGFVVNEMAEKIARFLEDKLINGAENKVTGLTGLSNTVPAAAANAIDADELIALQDAVKDIYQKDAIWIMSPATRTALRQLKDDVGRYLLQDDVTAPFGHTLLGKPVYVSDNVAGITTKKPAIYYGDFSGLAVKWVERINIEVLREKYATQHAIGVVGWFEFDAKIADQQKLAALVMA